jgi:hypothetical protein
MRARWIDGLDNPRMAELGLESANVQGGVVAELRPMAGPRLARGAGLTSLSKGDARIVAPSSSGRESPPPPPEPYVTVSCYTASTIRRVGEARRCQ